MSDIALDPNTGDMLITNGSLTLVDGVDAITQLLSQRLKMFFGEWFLDLSLGVPYFEQVFKKNFDPVVVDTIFKDVILSTPGILRLQTFSLLYDTTQRSLSLKFQAVSTEGVVDFNEVLGI
jgi:hypothetical protein